MKLITNKQINDELADHTKVYLCGHLSKPTDFPYFDNTGYEMGIADYKRFSIIHSHYHTSSEEYLFVLQGEMKIYIVNEQKEYTLSAGDWAVIETNMIYYGKAKENTRCLFTKSPGGNDKVDALQYEAENSQWLKEY